MILIAVMPDDSGSIRACGNEGKIIFSHNRVIEALNEIKENDFDKWDSIRFRTEYLNGKIVNNYVPLDETQILIGGDNVKEEDDEIRKELHRKEWIVRGSQNYEAVEGTPLYDRTVELISSVIVQQEITRIKGYQSRAGILLMSDGEDEHSTRHNAGDVYTLVEEMRIRSNPHKPSVIAFLGVPGRNVSFRKIANTMGIYDDVEEANKRRIVKKGRIVSRILTPEASNREIRRAVDIFSSSVTA